MKRLAIFAALLVTVAGSVFAGGRLTKTQNDAALSAGRQSVAVKMQELESNAAQNNPQTLTVAADMSKLMADGMLLTSNEINFERGDLQKATIKRYNSMEIIVYDYNVLLKNNRLSDKARLVKLAQGFAGLY